MIELERKADCMGCHACMSCCPTRCITMKRDAVGFCYPETDISSCTQCNLCNKTCPLIQRGKLAPNTPADFTPRAFAFITRDEHQLQRSTSAAVFAELARATLEAGGVVFGARWTSDWGVKHDAAESWQDCLAFCRSKYVQSEMGDSFLRVKQYLKEGRRVLFSGVGCQIAGLRAFLKRDRDHPLLITLGIACYGAPPVAVWQAYLKNLQYLYNLGDIRQISFREKQEGSSLNFVIHGSHATYRDSTYGDFYGKGLANGLLNRPACNDCQFRMGRSGADITTGDFRDAELIKPEYAQYEEGISLVLCHNPKGIERIFAIRNQLSLLEEVPYAASCLPNKGVSICPYEHPAQAQFAQRFAQSKLYPTIALLARYQLGGNRKQWLKWCAKRLIVAFLCRLRLWHRCRDSRIIPRAKK